MVNQLERFDVSKPLLAAQRYKGNVLALDEKKQQIADTKQRNVLRQGAVSGNNEDLRSLAAMSPQDALAISKITKYIDEVEDPRILIDISKKSDFMSGFVTSTTDETSFKENLKYMKDAGYDTSQIGDTYDPGKIQFLAAINNEIKKKAVAKLTVLGVGDGNVQSALVTPSSEAGVPSNVEFLGKKRPQFAPKTPAKDSRGGAALKPSEARSIGSEVELLYGGRRDPITNAYMGGIAKGKEEQVLKVKARASRIWADNKKMTYTEAAQQAFGEFKNPSQGGQSQYPSPQQGGQAPVPGAQYSDSAKGWFVKQNNQWFKVE